MFGHSSGTIKYDINTGIKFEGTGADMKLTTGYNIKDNNYFIYITDRKTKITLRINMDAEYYKNFFAMGKYVFKQHSEPESKQPKTNDEIPSDFIETKEDVAELFP